MGKTLLVDDALTQDPALKLMIESYITKDLKVLCTIQEAIEYIEENKLSIEFAVCRYTGKNEQTMNLFLQLLKDVPILILNDQNSAAHLTEGIRAKEMITLPRFPLQPALKLALQKLKRLSSANNSLSKNDKNIVDERSKKLQGMLASNNLSKAEIEREVEETVEIVQDLLIRVGFAPEIEDMVKKTAQLIIKLVSKDGNLSEILERFENHKGKYIGSHSTMLAEMCCAIARRIGWDSHATYLKLSIAAILHDITFKDQSLAKIQFITPASHLRLAKEQIEEVIAHPIVAAEYARQFQDMPSDVDCILAEHHERPNGSGFPRALPHTRVHPLSALFIISHDVLNDFMSGNLIGGIEAYLQEHNEIYAYGTYKKIAQAIISNRTVK